MRKDEKMMELLDIAIVSRMIGVSVDTLRRWDKLGKLKAIQLATNGKRRYKREDIEKFIKDRSK